MRSLLRSFQYALKGIQATMNGERNFRIHLTAMVYVLFFSRFYQLDVSQYALLLVVFAVMLSAEMMNTAVEELVNREFEGYHPMAKKAKDIAAGAVMVCAMAAVGVGLLFFWNVRVLLSIFTYFALRPLAMGLLLLSFVFSILFIMGRFCDKDQL
ncbi:MAG: diacylglycerol kinase family protein [Eubacteriales bacterium]|jgi:diacylglycerol kinase (ATP)